MLTGYKWADPSHITYSIAPDGVYWGHGTNTLNAYFNSTIGTNGTWQRAIAKALATWESVANINISQVADGSYDEDVQGKSQGDPRFGDIRIGGYSYSNNTTTLAATAFPPPQGYTIAGDVQINTNLSFKTNGGSYDLYSVLLHETGHSLGLNHATNTAEVMDATYQGVRSGLAPGDIAGIQAIYGARQLDVYQRQGFGLTSTVPIDMSPQLVSAASSLAGSASLTKIGDVEWFTFVAPSYATGSWQATASAANLSLLSPKVLVYDANGNQLGQASNPSAWGDSVTASMANLVAGQRYYVAVTGATSDVFSVGAYQLTVTMSNGPPYVPTHPATVPVTPQATPPVTTPIVAPQVLAPTIAPDRFESNNTAGTATNLGSVSQGTWTGLTVNTAADVDFYTLRTTTAGVMHVAAAGTWVQVLNTRGAVLAQGMSSVDVSAARNTTLYVRVQSPNFSPVASYSLGISIQAPTPVKATLVRIGGRVVAKAPPRVVARPAIRLPLRLARLEASPTAAVGWSVAMRTGAST